MQRIGNLVMVFGLVVVAVCQSAAADDAFAKAMKEVNGVWKPVTRVIDGAKVAEDDLQDSRLMLEDGKWTAYKDQEVVATGTYKIVGLEKDCMKYDVTNDAEDQAGKISADISKLEGDTLTICIAPAGKERPTSFESKPGSGHRLTVYQREKR